MAERRQRDDPLDRRRPFGISDVCCVCLDQDVTPNVALLNEHGEACHVLCAACFPATVSIDALLARSGAKCPLCRSVLSGFHSFTKEEVFQMLLDAQAEGNIAGSPSRSRIPATAAELVFGRPQPRPAAPPPPPQPQQQRPLAAAPPRPRPPPRAAPAAAADSDGDSDDEQAPPPPPPLPPATNAVFCRFHGDACGIVRATQGARNQEVLVFRCKMCSKKGNARFGVNGALCYASGEGGVHRGVPHCTCKKPMAYRVSQTAKNPNRPFYCCADAKMGDKKSGCDCWVWGADSTRVEVGDNG